MPLNIYHERREWSRDHQRSVLVAVRYPRQEL